MATLADGISFVAASAGTGTFVFGGSRVSYRTLAQANSDGSLPDASVVSYLAVDNLASPSQREWGHGTYSLAGNSIARTTVLGSMNGLTDGGATALNFSVAPIVFLTALAEDFILLPASGNLTWFVSTTGSDSNNGLTSGTAFLTMQHALNVAKQYDYQGLYVPTINVGAGTFTSTSEILLPQLVGIKFDVNTGGGQIIGSGASTTTIASSVPIAIFRAQGTNCAWNFQSIGFNSGNGWVWDTVGACNITAFGGSGLAFNGTNYALVLGNGGTVHFIAQSIAMNGVGAFGGFGQLFFNTNFILRSCTITFAGGSFHAGTNEDINNYSSLQLTNNTYVNTLSGGGITANTYGSLVTDNGLTSDYPSTGSNFFSFDDTSSIINNTTSVASFGHNGLAGIPTTSNISPGFWSVWKDTTGGGVYVVYNDAGTIKKVQLV